MSPSQVAAVVADHGETTVIVRGADSGRYRTGEHGTGTSPGWNLPGGQLL